MYTKIKRIDRYLCTPLLQIISEIVALFRVSIASKRKLRVSVMFPVVLGKTRRAFSKTVALISKMHTTSARLRRPALQVDTSPASMRSGRLQLLDMPAAPTWCALSRTGQLASTVDLFCKCRPGRPHGHRPDHHRAALDHQLQHVAAAGAHGAGQLVDSAT